MHVGHTKNVHLDVYFRPHQNEPVAGIHVRARDPRLKRKVWRQVKFEIRGGRRFPGLRGTWKAEASTWLTNGARGNNSDRLSMKAYVRFKIGLGGPRPSPAVARKIENRRRKLLARGG